MRSQEVQFWLLSDESAEPKLLSNASCDTGNDSPSIEWAPTSRGSVVSCNSNQTDYIWTLGDSNENFSFSNVGRFPAWQP